MWIYEKKLQYPIHIKNPNPSLASMIISQVGGPDGEMSASMRYLHQRYSMPDGDVVGMLTDIGTEELAHLEMVATIIHQLTRNISDSHIMDTPFVSLVTRVTNFPTGIWLSCSCESFSICSNKSIRIFEMIFCPTFCKTIDWKYEQTRVIIKIPAYSAIKRNSEVSSNSSLIMPWIRPIKRGATMS